MHGGGVRVGGGMLRRGRAGMCYFTIGRCIQKSLDSFGGRTGRALGFANDVRFMGSDLAELNELGSLREMVMVID